MNEYMFFCWKLTFTSIHWIGAREGVIHFTHIILTQNTRNYVIVPIFVDEETDSLKVTTNKFQDLNPDIFNSKLFSTVSAISHYIPYFSLGLPRNYKAHLQTCCFYSVPDAKFPSIGPAANPLFCKK